jgi:Na+/H+ antiporter NhaD/arsenite permease-like protein
MTLLIFLATYVCVATGGAPRLRVGRTGAAVGGAILMIATGAIDGGQALRAIDVRTIVLLLVMMILVAPLQVTGVLTSFVRSTARIVHHPAALLAMIVVASGVLSAVFINDTICVVFTPIVVELAAIRRHRPAPYLLALATAANIGSTATIIGNPQNILIGSVSGIGFWRFARKMAPVALAGFAIDVAILCLLFRDDLHRRVEDDLAVPPEPRRHRRGISARGVARAVDWNLLLLFAGLFVVVAAADRAGIDRQLFDLLAPVGMRTVAGLTATTAVLSNVISNVPAVMLFTRLVPRLPEPERAWLTLAMASTLAGNLTILGSIANLIVVEGAKRRGVTVSFGEYARVGTPVTLATMAFGVYWLS